MPVSEITTELISEAAAAVSHGERPQRALVRFGASGPDASRWLAEGEQHAQEGIEDDVARLWRALDQAEADCEGDWIKKMRMAAGSGRRGTLVRAEDYLKMLQARFPDGWRAQSAVRGKRGESMEETLRRITSEGGAA